MQFIASSIFSYEIKHLRLNEAGIIWVCLGRRDQVLDKYIFVFIQIKCYHTNCISDLFVNELLLVINKISIDKLENVL